MPHLGRWMAIDPLAEKHPDWTPYNYVLGNPLNLYDPDGRQVDVLNGGELGEVQVIDERFTARLFKTLWYDFKHAAERTILNSFGGKWIKNPGEGMKWQVDYARDEYGSPMFETRISAVPQKGFFKEGFNNILDALTIFAPFSRGGAGSLLTESNISSNGIKQSIANAFNGGKKFYNPNELGLVDGQGYTVNEFIEKAILFLGEGYKELVPKSGRFVSADGRRVVRMGESDINGWHGSGPHMNFEILGANPNRPGRLQVTENYHLYFTD